MKLNDADVNIPFIWVGDDLLACVTREYAVRVFEIQAGDTYLLYGTAEINEKQNFTTISYASTKGIVMIMNEILASYIVILDS